MSSNTGKVASITANSVLGARSLRWLRQVNNTLTTLHLDYNSIGDEGARAVAEALKVRVRCCCVGSLLRASVALIRVLHVAPCALTCSLFLVSSKKGKSPPLGRTPCWARAHSGGRVR